MSPDTFLVILAVATFLVVAWRLLRSQPVPWWTPPSTDAPAPFPSAPPTAAPPAASDPFAAPCDCGPPLPPLPPDVVLVGPLTVPLAGVLQAGYTEIVVLGPFAVVRPICTFGPCTAARPLLERFCPVHAAVATRAAPDPHRN